MKGQVIFLWTKRPSWKDLEAQLHPYLRQLERLLDCPAADRRRCLKDTLRMAKDFADGSPAPSREEILKFLGTPQEVAENFLETLDPDVLRRHRAKKVWLRRGLAVLAVVTILFLAARIIILKNAPMEVLVQDTLIIYEEVPKT